MVCIRTFKRKGRTYYGVVKTFRQNGKVRQDVLYYIGNQTKLTEFLLDRTKVKDFFSTDLENLLYQTPLSLWNLMEQMRFREIFAKNFSKNWGVDAATVACIMILNYATERQSKCRFSDWYAKTYLPHLLNVPAQRMNKDLLCRTMDFFTEEKIESIHAELFKTAKKLYGLSDKLLFYDITAVTFEGSCCELAKKGYNPNHSYGPQINLAMPVTVERFPASHKVFEGNTKDVRTFRKSIELVEKTGSIDKSVFIFDRGIVSDENLELLKSKHAQFICGLPKNNRIKTIIALLKETDFTKIDDDISFCEMKEKGHRLLLFWSKKLQDENKIFRDKRIKKVEQKLTKLSKTASRYEKSRLYEKIGQICGTYRRFFDVKAESTFSFCINQKELDKASAVEGKYGILTNTEFAPKEVLAHYRDRNFIEMSFKDLKLFVDIRPVRHWKEERVLAHVFMAVLALGLRSIVELKVRRAGMQITSEEAIRELNKVRALVAKGKVLRLTGETEETKKILEALKA